MTDKADGSVVLAHFCILILSRLDRKIQFEKWTVIIFFQCILLAHFKQLRGLMCNVAFNFQEKCCKLVYCTYLHTITHFTYKVQVHEVGVSNAF